MKEEPSLEAHKHALVIRLAEGRKKLQDIEDQILRLLTDARGCLLDDLELITALQVRITSKAPTVRKIPSRYPQAWNLIALSIAVFRVLIFTRNRIQNV